MLGKRSRRVIDDGDDDDGDDDDGDDGDDDDDDDDDDEGEGPVVIDADPWAIYVLVSVLKLIPFFHKNDARRAELKDRTRRVRMQNGSFKKVIEVDASEYDKVLNTHAFAGMENTTKGLCDQLAAYNRSHKGKHSWVFVGGNGTCYSWVAPGQRGEGFEGPSCAHFREQKGQMRHWKPRRTSPESWAHKRAGRNWVTMAKAGPVYIQTPCQWCGETTTRVYDFTGPDYTFRKCSLQSTTRLE